MCLKTPGLTEMMRSKWRGVASALAALTPLGALAVGEGSVHYDEDHKVECAKHQLQNWRRQAASSPSVGSDKQSEDASTAWLGSAPPKFPYLLAISPGDDPAVVFNALLSGSRVLGSYDEDTRATMERLTAPTSEMETVIHKVASRYSEVKARLYPDVPADFGPHPKELPNAEDVMMNALVTALKELRNSSEIDEEDGEENGEKGIKDATDATESENLVSTPDANTQPTPPTSEVVLPVFFLRDFDALNDQEAEKWLNWTFQLTNEGLAHVVLLTTSATTPSKMQWLQSRHLRGLGATSPDSAADFVAVLLRTAKGAVDTSIAEEKLRKLSAQYELNLFRDAEEEESDKHADRLDYSDDKLSHEQDNRGLGSAAEVEIIVQATGNWWSDMEAICQRLMDIDLGKVTSPEERLAMIRQVCESYLQESEVELLAALHMDGSLVLGDTPAAVEDDDNEQISAPSVSANVNSDSLALSALETWKCLETVAGVAPVNGGSGVVGSAQELLKKDDLPLNCAKPVNALMPFNARAEGEQKFLDLIDQRMLFLRPKGAVEIGVIPCEMPALVSPCWVQVRPVVKKAFERIWRNDAYFNIVLDLERFAANNQLREEVDLYEQELADRRRALVELKRDFAMIMYSLTPAEKAQRKAELALIDVEVQAKEVYLEKLRSLLSP